MTVFFLWRLHWTFINEYDLAFLAYLQEKVMRILVSLYSFGLMNLWEDKSSHQSFPSAPLEAARFRDKHEGLLRHWKVQSKASYTVNVLSPATFKKWYFLLQKHLDEYMGDWSRPGLRESLNIGWISWYFHITRLFLRRKAFVGQASCLISTEQY